MSELTDLINQLRAVPHAPWRAQVRRVAVILTSSRSGSTLFKAALAGHRGIAALDGEAEPFLALTGNGFGCNSDSDAIAQIANIDALADNIFDGLSVPSEHLPSQAELKARWYRRMLLQFPALFSEPTANKRLQRALDESLSFVSEFHEDQSEQELLHAVLGSVHWHQRERIDYFDGKMGPGEDAPFDEPAKIEEPPFVLPALYKRRFAEADCADKVLLFKTPSDAYRPGFYEQLFPQAEVRYIHLTRGYAQSVNGLMDGWLSPTGFFAHDMERAGATLAIKGYSDTSVFGKRWWKFDLPPNWREFIAAPLEEVCLNQWLSCHQAILASGVPTLRIAFEDFLADPVAALARSCEWLGLPAMEAAPIMPVLMATDDPSAGRWRKRSAMLLPLVQRAPVAQAMQQLGYSLDPGSWQ